MAIKILQLVFCRTVHVIKDDLSITNASIFKQSQSELIQLSNVSGHFPDSLWEADCVDSARLTLDGVFGGESASVQCSGSSWGVLAWPLSPSVLKDLCGSVSVFAALTDSLVSTLVSLIASAAASAEGTQSLLSRCRRRKLKEKDNMKASRRTNWPWTLIFIHAISGLTSLSASKAW